MARTARSAVPGRVGDAPHRSCGPPPPTPTSCMFVATVRRPGRRGAAGRCPSSGGIAATPELLAAVDALPPATDTPRLPGEDPTAPDPGFRLVRLLRPVRGLLAVTIAARRPRRVDDAGVPDRRRLRRRLRDHPGAPGPLLTAVLLGLGIVALSWVVVAVQTVVTARAGESLLYLLRVRSYAHLQRLGLDYYERELSGRIMTRMTTDVDALSSFLQTGLAQAVVSLLTVVGVAVALLVTDPAAGAGRARHPAGADRGDALVPGAVVARVRRGARAGGRRQRRHAGERDRRAGRPGLHRASSTAPRGSATAAWPTVAPGCARSATSRRSSRSSRC